ncbi:efflux RND transporter permease subunit [Endothiovibrio diazotrophicus]
MRSLITVSLDRSRTVLMALAFILIAGSYAYSEIPKESDPDVAIPILYVSMSHEGISPEDAERLLVRPMEKELQGVEGIKEMRATAREGQASVVLEFEAGFDADKALNDVREKVDLAKAELPDDTDEPIVNEVNVSLFPVLVVALAGDVPERTLVTLARDLRDKIEGITEVLDAEIGGDREDAVEILLDPARMESHGIAQAEVFALVARNNQLVAAGTLDTGSGRFPVKVPGLIESAKDLLDLPLKVRGDRVITVRDVATVRRTYKDPDGFARVGGRPAVTLEVAKRTGENIIETIEKVKALVAEESAHWPAGVEVSFSGDRSSEVRNMLSDLQNNILSAVALVMVVIVAALGLRSAGLVGLAIPGSFLAGILVLSLMGMTMNIVVLFSLILAAGMLIDGAIVVTEFADRKMAEGLARREAYSQAARRMAWPITASTLTTLAAFAPLLFWPGVVGEFMKYLPLTLVATLTASLLMALIFVPTLGGIVGRPGAATPEALHNLAVAEHGDLDEIRGLSGLYVKVLKGALHHPVKILLAAFAILIGGYTAYGLFGNGVEFFPDVEPEQVVVHIHARGNLSALERDALVREVEGRILDMAELKSVYSRSGERFGNQEVAEDVIGVIQLELVDWQRRRKASQIMDEIRERTADIAGIHIEVRKPEAGPPVGKPVQLQLSSRYPELLEPAVEKVRAEFESLDGLRDIQDSRPVPGIEWQVTVDREQASRFGADVVLVGNAIKLVTNGLKVGDYRPVDADDEVDILARLLKHDRDLDQLDQLRLQTDRGLAPLTNFVTRKAAPKLGTIQRVDARRVMTVSADVEEGVLPDAEVRELRQWLKTASLDKRVTARFKGEDEEQEAAKKFLTEAFFVALFIMAIILVTQFNSFYQALLILSAVIFSTVGVMLGLLVTGEPFGIVMSGVGVIALAGIVVNNNIVLIDTYNVLRRRGMEPYEAVLRTGAQRLRPVFLTTVTTILGLLPMVYQLNINLFTREIEQGAPSTQWWTQLATAVAGGLTFATLLTLVMTPCMLMLKENVAAWWHARRITVTEV